MEAFVLQEREQLDQLECNIAKLVNRLTTIYISYLRSERLAPLTRNAKPPL